ncbi:response regulator transcription factor [Paenibacillus sp. strain BS8-2]
MYKILVVDDEPRVSMGIRNFLLASDLKINYIETALNGFEAIDYLRMDHFDLVLTDIQMGRMSGLELMETIYMEQPHLPIIVISAHEKFEFAKKSLRLGARDYLVKPVEQIELLRVVGQVLQEKEEYGKQTLEQARGQKEEEKTGMSRRNELLMELVTEKNLNPKDYDELLSELKPSSEGACFGMLSIRLELGSGGFSNRQIKLNDRKLLKYGAVNIIEESLQEWKGLVFNGYGNELIAMVQIYDYYANDSQQQQQLKSQLQLIGQLVTMNIKQYLNIESAVGLSTLSPNVFMLPKLMEEAGAAIEWRKLHPGQKVFYFDDIASQQNLNIVEWMNKVDEYMELLKSSSEDPASIVPSLITGQLTKYGPTEELFNSCFGMLVYRMYGLLLEYGHSQLISLHRFDPSVYFRNSNADAKLEALNVYIGEVVMQLYEMGKERDKSILARITGYIREHYRNPALKIQDIANEVHFSTAYLGYLFKKEMKKNLWDFVTEQRIEEAKRLLTSTDKKRYEVAYEVGYESPEHFSRMFKRYVGISPAEFRKDIQG